MKKAGSTFSSDHPDEFLLPYVEELLGPDDHNSVREHLRECPRCSTQVDDLRRLVAVLRTEKTVFCPEPSSLYEFAVNGADPGESISKHVEICGVCREEVEAFRASIARPDTMGADLWAQVQQRLPRTSPEKDSVSSPPEKESFFGRFFTQFTVARLAAAAAVAVVLVSVMWHPGEIPQPMVAASSVTWENAPKPKSEVTDRKRLALLILLKDFAGPPPQKMIDTLYETLEPGVDISERYRPLAPSEVRGTVKNLSFSPAYRKESLETLRKSLDASLAVLITIIPVEKKFEVRGEMVDTATDKVLGSTRSGPVAEADLPDKAREIVHGLILQQ